MKKKYSKKQSNSFVPRFEYGTDCRGRSLSHKKGAHRAKAYDRWRVNKMKQPGYVSLTPEELQAMEDREARLQETAQEVS